MKNHAIKSIAAVFLLFAVQNARAAEWVKNKVHEVFQTANHPSNTVIKAAFTQCLREAQKEGKNDNQCFDLLVALHKAKHKTYQEMRKVTNSDNDVLSAIDAGAAVLHTGHAIASGMGEVFSESEEPVASLCKIGLFPLKKPTSLVQIGEYNITDKRAVKYALRAATHSPEWNSDNWPQAVGASMATDATLDYLGKAKKNPIKVNRNLCKNYPYIQSVLYNVLAPWAAENAVFNAYMNAANAVRGKPCGVYVNFTYGGN